MSPLALLLFFMVGALAVAAAQGGDGAADAAPDDGGDLGGGAPDMAAPDLSVTDQPGAPESAPEGEMMPSRKVFDVPASGAQYAPAIRAAEVRYGLPESLLARVIYQESRFRDDVIAGRKKSTAGAIGIAQFMPGTAARFNINPLDPYASIDAAARYLRANYNLLGDWVKAVAGYNWGEGNVQEYGLNSPKMPDETKNYIAEIFADVSV